MRAPTPRIAPRPPAVRAGAGPSGSPSSRKRRPKPSTSPSAARSNWPSSACSPRFSSGASPGRRQRSAGRPPGETGGVAGPVGGLRAPGRRGRGTLTRLVGRDQRQAADGPPQPGADHRRPRRRERRRHPRRGDHHEDERPRRHVRAVRGVRHRRADLRGRRVAPGPGNHGADGGEPAGRRRRGRPGGSGRPPARFRPPDPRPHPGTRRLAQRGSRPRARPGTRAAHLAVRVEGRAADVTRHPRQGRGRRGRGPPPRSHRRRHRRRRDARPLHGAAGRHRPRGHLERRAARQTAGVGVCRGGARYH